MKIEKTKYFQIRVVIHYVLMITVISILLSACSGCSHSALREAEMKRSAKQESLREIQPKGVSATLEKDVPAIVEKETSTVVKMVKVDGVYQIPTEIDGIPMHFIFDTGAGSISISEVEATFLYKQDKLSDSDIIGSANFIDANGKVSEGTVINLKTVKLGDRVLKNIEASVVHNLDAPLLMGQSALEKFGKISIDYQKGEITFE